MERNTASFDLSKPLDVYRFAVFLGRLRAWYEGETSGLHKRLEGNLEHTIEILNNDKLSEWKMVQTRKTKVNSKKATAPKSEDILSDSLRNLSLQDAKVSTEDSDGEEAEDSMFQRQIRGQIQGQVQGGDQ